ncbi:hypothetical protein MKW94_008003 [Papaver nudicaule]|uniref:Myb/SANT-like domain-containing protein n=1 Tax=Papaver nudicaule TaxID=74823 RepID=A0AA41SDZ2_PAPNU|nr:hypothetical protein [Papaver nudicaule]
MASSSNYATIPLFEEANEVPAAWSVVHESYFIDLMLDKKYYTKFGLKYSLKAFKNKFTKLKERYKDHKKLVDDNTGLGWDPILCTVDAPNEWWDDHVKSFPRDKAFRINGCPEYGKLAMIFGDTVATGNLRQTQDGGFSSTDNEDEDNQDGGTQVSGNNNVGADDMERNMDNQFRRRSRVPGGSNRSTHVTANNGDVADEIEDNLDDPFRRRSRTPSGGSRRGRKILRCGLWLLQYARIFGSI